MTPKKVGTGTREWKKLEAVAKLLEAYSTNGYLYMVEDVYFDYGQDWEWTTIVCYHPIAVDEYNSWQVLNPKEWEEILTAEDEEQLVKVVKEIKADKYWLD